MMLISENRRKQIVKNIETCVALVKDTNIALDNEFDEYTAEYMIAYDKIMDVVITDFDPDNSSQRYLTSGIVVNSGSSAEGLADLIIEDLEEQWLDYRT